MKSIITNSVITDFVRNMLLNSKSIILHSIPNKEANILRGFDDMAQCSECNGNFEAKGDWQKMCPKCYYALNPKSNFRKQLKDRQLSSIGRYNASKYSQTF